MTAPLSWGSLSRLAASAAANHVDAVPAGDGAAVRAVGADAVWLGTIGGVAETSCAISSAVDAQITLSVWIFIAYLPR